MHIARILLILGVWVAVLRHLGFPDFLEKVLFGVTGFILIYLSLLIHKESKNRLSKNEQNKKEGTSFENFSENRNFSDIKTN